MMEQQSNNRGPRGLNRERRETISRAAIEIIQGYGGRAHTLQIVNAVSKYPGGDRYASSYDVKSVLDGLPHFRIVDHDRFSIERPNLNGRNGTRKVSVNVAIWTYEE